MLRGLVSTIVKLYAVEIPCHYSSKGS